MMTGVFINFNVPYSKDGVSVLPQNQAEDILKKANDLVINGAKGVAITYSDRFYLLLRRNWSGVYRSLRGYQ